MYRIVALIWSIWKTRNNEIFRNETSNPELFLLCAKRASAEWRIRQKLFQIYNPSSHTPSTSRHKQSRWITWRKPPVGFVKLNFDGSKTSQGAARGFVVRDWSGRFLQAAAFNLGAASILVAEVTAMRNALKAAIHAGFMDIITFSFKQWRGKFKYYGKF